MFAVHITDGQEDISSDPAIVPVSNRPDFRGYVGTRVIVIIGETECTYQMIPPSPIKK